MRACTILDRVDLLEATRHLCAGFPDEISITPVWTDDGKDRCTLSVEVGRWGMEQVFLQIGDRLEVNYRGFFLPDTVQRKGLARRAIRASLPIYDLLGVDSVGFEAVDGGAYAWASLAGIPLYEDETRQDLLDRAARMPTLSPEERLLISEAIKSAKEDCLMYDVARQVSASGRRLGEELLTGYRWLGYWDLNDSDLRMRIGAVLNRKR